ncbi:helix-turn-helix domain-containing protein [Comamonas suwonensis]|nr:helix-turn-helix transcriptional regulator [Comamonas suwonensis]
MLYCIRQELGMSQAAAANLIEISIGYLSEIENGKRPTPSQKTILKIATGLALSGKKKTDFLSLATAERITAHLGKTLPPETIDLMIYLQVWAPHIDSQTLNEIRQRLYEATSKLHDSHTVNYGTHQTSYQL